MSAAVFAVTATLLLAGQALAQQSIELHGEPLGPASASATAGADAAAGAAAAASNWVMPANFKVAIVGDIDLRTRPISRDAGRAVYRLIKAEGAHMALCQGDLTYLALEDGLPDRRDIPRVWQTALDDVLGADFPFFSVAGNHDVEFGQWYTATGGGLQRAIADRLHRNGLDQYCRGQPGLNLFCVYKGLAIVQSGIGVVGDRATDLAWLRAQFDALDAHPQARQALSWRICAWHMPTAQYQTGSVPRSPYEDPTPEAYDICRRAGAFVVTGHEHAYARTRAITDFARAALAPRDTVVPPAAVPAPLSGRSSSSSTGPKAPREPVVVPAAPAAAAPPSAPVERMTLSRGTSFAVLNGCGTADVRPVTGELDRRPWWGAVSNAHTRGPPAVLFCTFNLNGDMNVALCELRGIWHPDGHTPVRPGDGGHVIDRFYLRNALNGAAPRSGEL